MTKWLCKILRSKFVKALLILAVLLFLRLGYIGFRINQYSYKYLETKSQVALVLGHASWNGKITPEFEERINHAVYLYNSGKVDHILISGGKSQHASMSDSRAAMHYVIRRGISQDDIYLEEKSTSTYENMLYSKPIIRENNWSSILLVTDPMHMMRSMKIAQNQNIHCLPSPTQTSLENHHFKIRFVSLIYEVLAYHLNWAKGEL